MIEIYKERTEKFYWNHFFFVCCFFLFSFILFIELEHVTADNSTLLVSDQQKIIALFHSFEKSQLFHFQKSKMKDNQDYSRSFL